MHDSKFQVFLFLGFIFFRTFFPGILFPETLLVAPIMLGKKVPGIQNPWLYFQWHFFQGLDKIRTFFQKFLFPGFFPETFYPGTFWHRFIYWEHTALKGRQNVCIFLIRSILLYILTKCKQKLFSTSVQLEFYRPGER